MESIYKLYAGFIIGTFMAAIGTIAITQGVSESKERQRIERKNDVPNIVGTVLDDIYENTLTSVPEKHIDGMLSQAYSNETVKAESKYTLKVKTDDGRIIGVSVIDGDDFKKESLDAIVNQGSRISFPAGNWSPVDAGSLDKKYHELKGETYFGSDSQIGTKRANRITVLN